MGPKAAKTPDNPVVKKGAPIFSIIVQFAEDELLIPINSKCRSDIIADYIKKQVIKYISTTLLGTEEAKESNILDEGKVATDEIVSRLKELLAKLQAASIDKLVLQDENESRIKFQKENFSQHMKELVQPVKYKLYVESEDENLIIIGD